VIHIQPDAARFVTARILLTLTLAALPLAAQAQQSQSGNGWFVPTQPKPGPTAGQSRGQPGGQPGGQAAGQSGAAPAAVPERESILPMVEPPQGALPPLQVQLPPTPAAIVGILSVPDILRISTAYQQADKELASRRNKLNEDGQKEQNTLRELGQNFANERAKLTPEQIRAKEKDYADRVNESRRKFSERARIVQEAGQYVMAQIERVIEQVAQQVAASRGVNLVLNRAQVLGTTTDFDLTPQVADVLNRILPTVVIPPDGVSPTAFKAPVAGPRASAAPPATPAAKN
jgi:Skp family chaperone for outer membrane proteins